MIRSLGILLFFMLPIAMIVAKDAKSSGGSKVFPYPIYQDQLDNGLKIVTIPFDSPGILAYYTVVRTGSRNEVEAGKSGFAHFFEHMMFRGTDKYPKDKFNDVLKAVGADNNAFTSDDQTVYHTFTSSAALEQMMDIESDRFMNLKYSEDDFKTEAGAILGEYNKSSSNPFQSIEEKIRDAAFTTHTYKHTTIGFLKDIQDMPNQYQYSLTFFSRWYRPENCVLVIVGDVQRDNVLALAKKYYSDWKRGDYKLDIPAEPPQTEEKTLDVPWKSKTLPILTVGYHGAAFTDTDVDNPSLDLLSQVYFSETSDIYRKLVVDQQLVEFVSADNSDHRDPALFSVYSRIKDIKDVDKVREMIYSTLEDAKTKPVDAEKLAAVKSHMRYAYAMGLNNANNVANSICSYIELTGDPESVNKVYALYDKVTPDDIMKAAQKYFTASNRTVLLLHQQEEGK